MWNTMVGVVMVFGAASVTASLGLLFVGTVSARRRRGWDTHVESAIQVAQVPLEDSEEWADRWKRPG